MDKYRFQRQNEEMCQKNGTKGDTRSKATSPLRKIGQFRFLISRLRRISTNEQSVLWNTYKFAYFRGDR
jgi:hypothetical protein